MPAVAIVNPEAGGGAALARWPHAARLLAERLGDVETRFTKAPGHASELARNAVKSGADLLIAAGGDGTVNEVLNGLLPEGGARLAVLPLASGGDLVRTLGLRGLHHAVDTIAGGRARAVDVIRVRFRSGADVRQRYCLNVTSIGLGAAVTAEVRDRWRMLPGQLRYIAAALRQLARGASYPVRISLDGGAETEWTLTTAALANGCYQGGGMHIAPRASLTDGLIDLTLIEHLTLAQALPRLHLLYTGGVYSYRRVHHRRAKSVRVEGEPEVPVELDGEPVGSLPLEAEIMPGALQLVMPMASGRPPSAG